MSFGVSKTRRSFPVGEGLKPIVSGHEEGFTLIELMVALTVMAITMTILLKATSGQQDQLRYTQTVERVERIRRAIVDVSSVNGVPTVSGFVADMGRLPVNIHELLEPEFCASDITKVQADCADWKTNPLWQSQTICQDNSLITVAQPDCAKTQIGGPQTRVTLRVGWNGPYLQTFTSPSHVDNQHSPGADALTDGWGNEGYNPPRGYPDNPLNPDPRHNYGWYFSNSYVDSNGEMQSGVTLYSYGNGCHLDPMICKGNAASPDLLDFTHPLSSSPRHVALAYNANGKAVTPDPVLSAAPSLPPLPIIRSAQWQVAIGDTTPVIGSGMGVNVTLLSKLNSCSGPVPGPNLAQCTVAGLIANPPPNPVPNPPCTYAMASSQIQCAQLGGNWTVNNQPLCLNIYYIQKRTDVDGNLSVVSADGTIPEDGGRHTVHFVFPLPPFPNPRPPVTIPIGNAAFSVHESTGQCTSFFTDPPPPPPNGNDMPTYPEHNRQAAPVVILPGQTPSFTW